MYWSCLLMVHWCRVRIERCVFVITWLLLLLRWFDPAKISPSPIVPVINSNIIISSYIFLKRQGLISCNQFCKSLPFIVWLWIMFIVFISASFVAYGFLLSNPQVLKQLAIVASVTILQDLSTIRMAAACSPSICLNKFLSTLLLYSVLKFSMIPWTNGAIQDRVNWNHSACPSQKKET